ncbi:MAG TPA: TylF/MycF/NovP-related O-methyltransferase [Steroidobacteraceae bacterium]|jgi:Macrocin-O-methyltransferase (TylF).|nr:TylF/MycF/NovP-related O-methyltransferase [Steroidobacteraceae bacterium]
MAISNPEAPRLAPVESVAKRAKRKVRESRALRLMQDASASWLAQRPLARVPGWLGLMHDIKVPRGVARLPAPTTSCAANINILLALLPEAIKLEGALAECGVYRGATLLPTGWYLKQSGSGKVVYGFDSFQGFDASVDSEIALGGRSSVTKRRGGFSDTSLEYVTAKVRRFGLQQQVRLVQGYLERTLRQYADQRFCFVHLDVDIYESYKLALEFFYPRTTPGAVILLDEYDDPTWPGCNKAVDEFLSDKPERLVRIERDNHVKYLFRKQ